LDDKVISVAKRHGGGPSSTFKAEPSFIVLLVIFADLDLEFETA
jgi:hypothetical protein